MTHDIEHLNADCTCVTLDRDALCRALVAAVGDPAFCQELVRTHPHLISAQPLFLSSAHAERMRAIIRAIESVAAFPAYSEAVLARAPEIARFRPGPVGVFMGYDFHLGPEGPQLIEINTNAGGALFNAYLLQAQQTCCAEMAIAAAGRVDMQALVAQFLAAFETEWRRQGRTGPLRSVAIVDERPREQYLYPEFVLFQRLFLQAGLDAVIAAPDELAHRNGGLWIGERRIDLVYNRLTDFALDGPASGALRSAYLAGDAVITPNPWAHAHFADKRNLVTLTDEVTLRRWGVRDDLIATLLAGIPRTLLLTPDKAAEMWEQRNRLFFKPCAGYGSKAAYRGDKITRKVWGEIVGAGYVAQALVPPSARTIAIDGRLEQLKADLRNYSYDGEVQLVAARLYQGQTTNFRTSGGGFAPVFVGSGDADCRC